MILLTESELREIIRESLYDKAKEKLLPLIGPLIAAKDIPLPIRFILNYLAGDTKIVDSSFFTKDQLLTLRDVMKTQIKKALRLEEKYKESDPDKFKSYSNRFHFKYLPGNMIRIPITYKTWGWAERGQEGFTAISGDEKWSWANSLGQFIILYDRNTSEASITDKYDFNPKEDDLHTMEEVLKRKLGAMPHGLLEWFARKYRSHSNEFITKLRLKIKTD
tara:strand:+ start:765 stop:1424 length:660 start_codon:yes stop_codon:yes gene_type:complete